MPDRERTVSTGRNVTLYPWFGLARSLVFWHSVWFLYFQSELSAAEAIVLYAIYDLAVTLAEVPSGYASDRIGRRFTLIVSAAFGLLATAFLSIGGGFAVFAAGQAMLGLSAAFVSGADTALLYESLAAEDRGSEIEAQELRAWRFTVFGVVVAAPLGGALGLVSLGLPFVVTLVPAAAGLLIALRFAEPPHAAPATIPQGNEVLRLGSLKSALSNPVLVWLFAVWVLMYGFSHLPFVFGQPFISEALAPLGLSATAPLVSGVTTSLMFGLAGLASLVAPRLRSRVGLAAMLMLAFGLQIFTAAVLALTNAAFAIVVLLLRMVPDAFSIAYIRARIQPLLRDESRATYMSINSLVARLVFAGSLALAAGSTSAAGQMPYEDIRSVLSAYVAVGILALAALWLTARRLPLDRARAAAD